MTASHARSQLRFLSSDKKVAMVSKGGKIKAKGKGTCTVIAFAHNGVSKQIKVTVKRPRRKSIYYMTIEVADSFPQRIFQKVCGKGAF